MGAKSIELLRLVHIQNKEEEDLVQEVLNVKLAALPKKAKVALPVYSTNDLTPAKEAELQAKLDALKAEAVAETAGEEPAPVPVVEEKPKKKSAKKK